MAIEFGVRPKTALEAIKRLPYPDHPLIGKDEAIAHLALVRKIVVNSVLYYLDGQEELLGYTGFPDSLVERKMVPLTDEDIALMETYSFYRSEVVGVEPFRAPDTKDGLDWGTLFSLKDEPWISVWAMSPWDIATHPLVLIEEHEPEDPEFPFTMGVVTPGEYASLTRELDEVLYGMACERAVRRRHRLAFRIE